jgi:hypothetical protein
LIIESFLFTVGLPEADDAQIAPSGSDDNRMRASAQQCQHAQACLAVIAAGVLNYQRGIPFEFRSQLKGQAALGYVPFRFWQDRR